MVTITLDPTYATTLETLLGMMYDEALTQVERGKANGRPEREIAYYERKCVALASALAQLWEQANVAPIPTKALASCGA